MKKINLYPILLAMLLSLSPVHLFASDAESPVATPAAEAARAEVLINRLEEIKKMDMSTLNRAEKKELRNEVRETKKELKTNGSGVYFSVAAIIIIILLLVLLL